MSEEQNENLPKNFWEILLKTDSIDKVVSTARSIHAKHEEEKTKREELKRQAEIDKQESIHNAEIVKQQHSHSANSEIADKQIVVFNKLFVTDTIVIVVLVIVITWLSFQKILDGAVVATLFGSIIGYIFGRYRHSDNRSNKNN